MVEYINKTKLLEELKQHMELAYRRYVDKPSNSPCYVRYREQYAERVALIDIIKTMPTVSIDGK